MNTDATAHPKINRDNSTLGMAMMQRALALINVGVIENDDTLKSAMAAQVRVLR